MLRLVKKNISRLSHFSHEIGLPITLMLVIGITLALILAAAPLYSQLFFYFDIARDAYEAFSISHGDIKVLGPGTDIEGLNHGVLWFYVLSFLYALFNQDVQLVATVFFVLFFLSLPVVGYLAWRLFENKVVAVGAVVLYAFSPLFQLSTRWLSNPILSFLVMPILLLTLWEYIQNQSIKKTVLLGVLYGIIIQSQLAFLLLLVFLPLYFLVFRLRMYVSHLLFFSGSILITISTILIGEAKFGWKGTSNLLHFVTSSSEGRKSFADIFSLVVHKVNELFSMSVLPFPSLFPIIIFVALLFFTRNSFKKYSRALLFISIWLINIILFRMFDTGISRSLFVFYPSVALLAILVAFLIMTIVKKQPLFIAAVISIVLLQIMTNLNFIKKQENPLTVQKGMTLAYQKHIVDYTYKSSGLMPFTINTLTVPLYINTTWAHLYNFYGTRKYGYLPFWDGKDQKGYLGSLPKSDVKTVYRYLIIEPTSGIPEVYIGATIDEENAISTLVEEKKFGNFRVQKRLEKLHE